MHGQQNIKKDGIILLSLHLCTKMY